METSLSHYTEVKKIIQVWILFFNCFLRYYLPVPNDSSMVVVLCADVFDRSLTNTGIKITEEVIINKS